jgi:hypothetical protein
MRSALFINSKNNKMIQVFKCDHCHHFTQDAEEMRMHEAKCSFNPTNKKCWSCKHVFEDGYPISGSMRGCEKKLDVRKGEEVGGCVGWEADA